MTKSINKLLDKLTGAMKKGTQVLNRRKDHDASDDGLESEEFLDSTNPRAHLHEDFGFDANQDDDSGPRAHSWTQRISDQWLHLRAKISSQFPLAAGMSMRGRGRGGSGSGRRGGSGSGFRFQNSNLYQHTLQSLERFFDFLISPAKRKDIHLFFLYIFIFMALFSLGKILAILLNRPTLPPNPIPVNLSFPQNPYLAQLNQVKAKNLFRTVDPLANDQDKMARMKKIICKEAGQVTALPISLLNTIVLQDSVKSLAAVQVRGSSDLLNVREGEKIQSMAEIGKIQRLTIVVKNLQTGECELVVNKAFMEDDRLRKMNVLSPEKGKAVMAAAKMQGILQDGNHFKISKKLINQKMGEIENVLTQARAIQTQNPDGTMAFKIVEIVPGSVFSYLGIQDGDQITQINGRKITGLNDVMNLFGTIQNVDNLQITIVKEDGVEQGLDYEFSK